MVSTETPNHLGWEVWLTPRYTPLPDMCYLVKFGSSATKGVRINKKVTPKLGSSVAPPLTVIEGHRNRRRSNRHLWFPINVPWQPWAYLVQFPR